MKLTHPFLPTPSGKCRHCQRERAEHEREFVKDETGKGEYVTIQTEEQ